MFHITSSRTQERKKELCFSYSINLETKQDKSRTSERSSRKTPSRMSWKIIGLITSSLFIVISAALSTLIWAVHSSTTEAATTPPIIATPAGRFVGVITNSKIYRTSYVAYRSIPFAKPPIGSLRFKPPQPLDDVHPSRLVNSDQYQKSCWSVTKKSTDPNYSEDCLYLNIYVPGSGETISREKKKPVMIWIHGGGFVAGTTFPEPDKLVTFGDFIVVTVNYRLGALGWLRGESADLPGNNGLWDQYMAMKWVKDYINFFGGDDESITLFGESSGAISAALHVLSPVSSPLFKKAILQSGGPTTLIARHYKKRAEEFSAMVGCSGYPSTSGMAECLRQVSIDNILKSSKASAFNVSLAQQQTDFIWMPIVDGNFIPDEPLKLLRNITYLEEVKAFDKDLLIGVLNNEGGLIVDHFITPITQSQISDVNFVSELMDNLLKIRYGLNYNVSQELKERIYSFYTGSQLANSVPHPQNVLELSGDIIFVVPAVEMALALSSCHQSITPCVVNSSEPPVKCSKTTSKTYLYHFDYCPQTDICAQPCMVHGADVAYEFPKSNFTNPAQQQLSDTLVDILTTFAKSSNPETAVTSGWPTFDTSTQSYLRFDISPSVRRYLYDYRVKFWLTQVPQA